MKVLWICNIPLEDFSKRMRLKIVAGGWMNAYAKEISLSEDMSLSVCFPQTMKQSVMHKIINNVEYWGFYEDFSQQRYDENLERVLEKVVNRVNPDIIHIWGTEYMHSLAMVNACSSIIERVIVSLQGLTSFIARHYTASLPLSVIYKTKINSLGHFINIAKEQRDMKKAGLYEVEILKKVKHVDGRTDWDRACVQSINPNIVYHHCDRILRSEFYINQWSLKSCKRHSIFISQAAVAFKGFHFMLEALLILLKEYPDVHVFVAGANPKNIEGQKDSTYHEYLDHYITKNALGPYITFLGALDEYKMCQQYLKTHVFVLPSSVDNSPNALAEAMILGVPCIASDVGGVSSMLNHNIEGFVYQYDAPYMLAYFISSVFKKDNLAQKFSIEARKKALQKFNRNDNVEKLKKIYHTVLSGLK